jgi:hypothetical protein
MLDGNLTLLERKFIEEHELASKDPDNYYLVGGYTGKVIQFFFPMIKKYNFNPIVIVQWAKLEALRSMLVGLDSFIEEEESRTTVNEGLVEMFKNLHESTQKAYSN